MKWKIFREKIINSWFAHHIIIILISISIGISLSQKVIFSSNTLFWTASAIVQAFGALIAIILAVGINQIQKIMTLRNEQIKGINLYFNTISGLKDKTPEAYKVGINGYNKIKMETEVKLDEVFKTLGGSIQSIALLIGTGIAILICSEPFEQLSKTSPQSGSSVMITSLSFLLIESFYCIQLLINRMRDTLLSLSFG